MNKRDFTRIVFKTQAEVKYGDVTVSGEIENLSLSGMMLRTSGDLPAETDLDIRIFLSGPTTKLSINLKGEVVRKEPGGMAFQFSGMDLDSFIHIKNIITLSSGDESLVKKEFSDYMSIGKQER